MKVISIRQPWAWAIIHAGKDIENRSWPTKFRGRVLVHASKFSSKKAFAEAFDFICPIVDIRNLNVWCRTGGIIGSVEIVDCALVSNSPWFIGPRGFVLRYPRPLPFTPCTGALGLFDCPGDVLDRLAL